MRWASVVDARRHHRAAARYLLLSL